MTGTALLAIIGLLGALTWRVGWPRQAPEREPVAFSVRGQRVGRGGP